MLAADPDLETLTPAATLPEVAATPQADVVVLVDDLGRGHGPMEVLAAAREQDPVPREHDPGPREHDPGPREHDPAAWVVLTEDVSLTEDVIAAGAHGCLAASSTPLQIGAAIRAAARGDQADLDQPVTGPLVQRVHRTTPPLTAREVEVLRLVGAGLGNQQIAKRLYLSPSSVKSHLSHTYGRLGVARRDVAVAEARRQGLL